MKPPKLTLTRMVLGLTICLLLAIGYLGYKGRAGWSRPQADHPATVLATRQPVLPASPVVDNKLVEDQPPLALVRGLLIDGTGSVPVPGMVILIRGHSIVAVGPGAAPGGRRRRGLIDLPIVSQMDFGHTDPMFVLPYRVQAEIDCDRQRFAILESAVTVGFE